MATDPHLSLEEDEPGVECTSYPPENVISRPKGSISGKPKEWTDAKRLAELIGKDRSED